MRSGRPVIHTRQFSEEVLFTTRDLTVIRQSDIAWLKERATQTPRKRIRLCAHRDLDDVTHEMFIVQPRGAYVKPHKHVGKEESFHLVEGSVSVVVFNDDQSIREMISMGPYGSDKPFYHRMPAGVYHTVLIESDVVVYHETASGPFRKADMVTAPWAPGESELVEVERFLNRLREASRSCAHAFQPSEAAHS